MSDTDTPAVKITISIDCTHTMPRHNIWPDRNGPESPTEDDVYKLIRRDLGIRYGDPIRGYHIARLIDEWNLSDCLTLDVEVSA